MKNKSEVSIVKGFISIYFNEEFFQCIKLHEKLYILYYSLIIIISYHFHILTLINFLKAFCCFSNSDIL